MGTLQPTSLLPSPTLQITRFLQFVKNVYADLPKTMVSHSLSLGPSSLPVCLMLLLVLSSSPRPLFLSQERERSLKIHPKAPQ